jgi:hypothetical protein
MIRANSPALAGVIIALSIGSARLLRAQEPQPAPAPAAAAPAAPAAPAVDSNELWVGEWEFTSQFRDSTVSGLWRINYGGGRFTGMVVIPGVPPSPISAMGVRDHFRNFSLTAYFNGDAFTFSGHLDNPRTVNGTLSTRGGMGRMRAQKRG